MTNNKQIAALEKRIEELTNQIGILEDIHAVRCLQHKYGYYLDKCLYEAVIDLFSEDCEVHFLGGIFRGRAGVKRLFLGRFRAKFAGGTDGPKPGVLMEHLQLQDVVEIAPDRQTAKARFRFFMQAGTHYTTDKAYQWWEGGLYENVYTKEEGIWKIKVLIPKMIYFAEYEQGWAYTKPPYVQLLTMTYPEDPLGPDELCKEKQILWPETEVFPFHYPHPITDEKLAMRD